MEKFSLIIDNKPFTHKPSGDDVAQIQVRLRNASAIKEVTIEELLTYISKGCTCVPSIPKDVNLGMKNSNFKQQQLIMVDVDNTDTSKSISTPIEVINNLREKGIKVLAFYHTFSSTVELPKYRLILLLDKPVEDVEKIQTAIKVLINLIPQADQACKNVSRLFYGTDGTKHEVKIVDPDAVNTLEDILKFNDTSKKQQKKPTTKHHTRSSEVQQLEKDFDLLSYMESENQISQSKDNSGNTVYFNTCKLCGHEDDLRYFRDSNRFYCYSSNLDKGGTIVDYLMLSEGLTEKEAIEKLYELSGKQKEPSIQEVIEETIKKQVEELHLNIIAPDKVDWINYSIKKEKIIYTVACSKLAEYIKKNLFYKFIGTSANRNVLKYFYVNGVYKQYSDNEFKCIIKAFIPLEVQKMADINEVFSQICTDKDCYIPIDKMNDDEFIINFKNGILHLDTGELTQHSPRYLSSIQLPCDYKEQTSLPKTNYFNNFMNDLTDGDEEIKKLILQFCGVTLSNIRGYRGKAALFLVGKGDCGKSVLRSLIIGLLGIENCSNIDLKDLESRFSKIQILNKRLVGSSDMGCMKIANLERFKSITGGDYITGEYKGMDILDFRYDGTLFMAGNQLPVFSGDKGDHVYRRFIIVECNNVIPPEKQDKYLVEHLLEEKDYIISLALQGARQFIKNTYKYDVPKKCLDLLESYKIDNDSVLTFIKECMVKRTEKYIHDSLTCGKTYDAYKNWYLATHRDKFYENRSEFKRIMINECGYIKTNSGQEYYLNYTLNDDARRNYCSIYSNTEEPINMPGVEEEDLPF